MVISGILVLAKQGKTEEVVVSLKEISGVEVHHVEDEKIVITLESETIDSSYEVSEQLEKVDHVAGVYLVYTNFEDDPSLDLEYRAFDK
ncbi:chaperone NapD [Effusibacillus lacus]|uniref:Chaperone NapD n=1 Tax=Effusibacillus lacus TaxID=1348429 RepID=A0A292YIP5_9BACL|nr:chaperone NapD [Effusibacillus lacus]TCS75366.1 periplasmic nitrate reductase chaperone NapD [Effusibacillus lacus]GAX89798.1 hypothetical protein EFBL_1423 [Effusibacillus lacus]